MGIGVYEYRNRWVPAFPRVCWRGVWRDREKCRTEVEAFCAAHVMPLFLNLCWSEYETPESLAAAYRRMRSPEALAAASKVRAEARLEKEMPLFAALPEVRSQYLGRAQTVEEYAQGQAEKRALLATHAVDAATVDSSWINPEWADWLARVDWGAWNARLKELLFSTPKKEVRILHQAKEGRDLTIQCMERTTFDCWNQVFAEFGIAAQVVGSVPDECWREKT